MLQRYIREHRECAAEPAEQNQVSLVKQYFNKNNDIPRFLTLLAASNIDDGFSKARVYLYNLAKQQNLQSTTELVTRLSELEVVDQLELLTSSDQLSYDTYLELKSHLSQINKLYETILSASLFSLMPSAQPTNKGGTETQIRYIYKIDFLETVRHVIWALHFKLELEQGYALSEGFVNDTQLQDFIAAQYKQFNEIITPEQELFYVCYCTKAICFLLNCRPEKVDIDKLVASFYLEAALKLEGQPCCFTQRVFGPLSRKGITNIFTSQAFLESYSIFQRASLKAPDSCGMLDMNGFRDVEFHPSEHFVRNLFYVSELFDGYIDYRLFLDYLFTVTFPAAPAAGKYAFKVLDGVAQKGYLDRQDVTSAFGSVYEDLKKIFPGIDIPLDNFVDEVFDNVHPKDEDAIYYNDIVRNGGSDYIVRYLVSAESFYEHEAYAQSSAVAINDVPWSG